MGAIWCFDLDGTLTDDPETLKGMMKGLRESGHGVQVLTGSRHDENVTPELVAEKNEIMSGIGLKQGEHYDTAVVVGGPEKKVPKHKVQYMKHIGATGLVDNSKPNIKAARKAGFVGLHFRKPKK
jgi:phage replication-related protein YjqB (UPF0714/DUF867 family)